VTLSRTGSPQITEDRQDWGAPEPLNPQLHFPTDSGNIPSMERAGHRRAAKFQSEAKYRMSDEQNPTETQTTATEEGGPEVARTKFQSGKAHAAKAAEDIRAAAEAKAKELREAAEIKAKELREAAETKAHEFRARAESVYGDYRTRARTFKDEGEHYIRENPLRAVLTALGVGFVLGLIFRR
jgi:ElaB/YqjD/DUF883 family membrane-anchored ribosome-binding protein